MAIKLEYEFFVVIASHNSIGMGALFIHRNSLCRCQIFVERFSFCCVFSTHFMHILCSNANKNGEFIRNLTTLLSFIIIFNVTIFNRNFSTLIIIVSENVLVCLWLRIHIDEKNLLNAILWVKWFGWFNFSIFWWKSFESSPHWPQPFWQLILIPRLFVHWTEEWHK